MGYLPDVYKDFIKQYPDINKSYDALANACHKAGPLDKKTRRLVKLGIAIGMNSEGGVRSHARRALEEGIIQTRCGTWYCWPSRPPAFLT
jgi:alkylhydroperoxidase/carboxymuconolactone decarboxylase family protein YurZ